jgi:hypothetical protein
MGGSGERHGMVRSGKVGGGPMGFWLLCPGLSLHLGLTAGMGDCMGRPNRNKGSVGVQGRHIIGPSVEHGINSTHMAYAGLIEML